jgi:glycosyltransferase involved in cell wall biosynthesis
MNLAEATISIIIPTHNRVDSIKRLLDKLSLQSCPVSLMEVIVVADSCTDATVSLLQNYKTPFKLLICETFGSGLAGSRNEGASLAFLSMMMLILWMDL